MIANNPIYIPVNKEQPDRLMLADYIAETDERRVWHQDQEQDQTDREALEKYRPDHMIERVCDRPGVDGANDQFLQCAQKEQHDEKHQCIVEGRPDQWLVPESRPYVQHATEKHEFSQDQRLDLRCPKLRCECLLREEPRS